MKERPILMNAPMVCATLDGRKTQTRRVVKFSGLTDVHSRLDGSFSFETTCGNTIVKCPYGKQGDRLWVRETFAEIVIWYAPTDPRTGGNANPNPKTSDPFFVYRATEKRPNGSVKWTPSIHMPKRVCRIMLEITGIRVERLNDISDSDAEAESCSGMRRLLGHGDYDEMSPSQEFQQLWESINGAGSWNKNPWVWVIEFKMVKP